METNEIYGRQKEGENNGRSGQNDLVRFSTKNLELKKIVKIMSQKV